MESTAASNKMAGDGSNDWQADLTISEANLYMYENKLATDVKFTFQSEEADSDEVLEAHSYVLMSRSTVFFTMFQWSKDSSIVISDIPYSTFNLMLRYLYTGQVTIDLDNVLPLLYVANKYMISALIKECGNFLYSAINLKNIAMILSHAVLYNMNNIRDRCLDILKIHQTVWWLENHHVSHATLLHIVSDPEFICDEAELLTLCNKWAIQECKVQELKPTMENRRKVLGPILYAIHLPTINTEVLAMKISPLNLLTEKEELEAFRHASGLRGGLQTFPSENRAPSIVIRKCISSKLSIYSQCRWQLCGFKFAEGYCPKMYIKGAGMNVVKTIDKEIVYLDKYNFFYSRGDATVAVKLMESRVVFKLRKVQIKTAPASLGPHQFLTVDEPELKNLKAIIIRKKLA